MDEITFCKKNDFKNLIKFLKNNWHNKNTSISKTFFFNWMYFNKKLNKYNFLIIKKNNKIKACLGLLINSSSSKKVVWLTFWLVDRKNRENINGIDLINYVIKCYKNSIIATTGMNYNTIPIYNILGFRIKNLNHHFMINPYIKKFKLIKIKKMKIKNIKKNEYTISISKKIDFLKKNKNFSKFQKKFLKNISYFINKYQSHPIYKYEFYLIKNRKNIFGFFVGRICVFKKRKALRFVEYFGSINKISYIKFSLCNLLKKNKYEYLDFYNLGIEKKLLQKAGFQKNKFSNKIVIPNYFEPFEKRNVNIQCVTWPKKTEIPVFKGDGDQDRPRF